MKFGWCTYGLKEEIIHGYVQKVDLCYLHYTGIVDDVNTLEKSSESEYRTKIIEHNTKIGHPAAAILFYIRTAAVPIFFLIFKIKLIDK